MPPLMIVGAHQPVRGKNPPKIIGTTTFIPLIGEIKKEILEELELLWTKHIYQNEPYGILRDRWIERQIEDEIKKLKLHAWQFTFFLNEVENQLNYVQKNVLPNIQGKHTTEKKMAKLFEDEVSRLGSYFNLFKMFADRLEQQIKSKQVKHMNEEILKKLRDNLELLEKQLEMYSKKLEELGKI